MRGYRIVKKLIARKAYTVTASSYWQLAITPLASEEEVDNTDMMSALEETDPF